MDAVTTLPRGRPLTVADLESMPDDGHRYELIDGTLVVTPAPSIRHQTVSGEFFVLLHSACPSGLRVLAAPTDVVLGDDTGVQPDLLVARREDFTDQNLPTAPLLAVEILSPNTRLVDLNLKRAAYERAGVASYWVVDPEEPRLRVFELRQGAYVEVADVAGDESWTAEAPYAVTVVPNRLAG
jgi:Uma2 family endonuclease